jgi:hypothetical protein
MDETKVIKEAHDRIRQESRVIRRMASIRRRHHH